VSAARSAASAIGDRQTLPVHTMRIEAIAEPRVYRWPDAQLASPMVQRVEGTLERDPR
jgi:hypothetical protein